MLIVETCVRFILGFLCSCKWSALIESTAILQSGWHHSSVAVALSRRTEFDVAHRVVQTDGLLRRHTLNL